MKVMSVSAKDVLAWETITRSNVNKCASWEDLTMTFEPTNSAPVNSGCLLPTTKLPISYSVGTAE